MSNVSYHRSPCAHPRMLWATSLLLAVLGCGGSSAHTTTATTESGPWSEATGYRPGESVQVEWHGSWYAATILDEVAGGQYHIHYDGWSDEWNEVVDTSRIRTSGEVIAPPDHLLTPEALTDESGAAIENTGSRQDPGGFTPTPDVSLQPGLRVHVEWRGSWYLAEILEAPDYGAGARVHYLGWSSDWDEVVERSRIRVNGAQP